MCGLQKAPTAGQEGRAEDAELPGMARPTLSFLSSSQVACLLEFAACRFLHLTSHSIQELVEKFEFVQEGGDLETSKEVWVWGA